jgi:hypothetical protein
MRLLFILILLFGASVPAAAFVVAGALEISIQDLNGKPVPEATVYAIYSERVGGRVPRYTADAEGKVSIRNLSPGTYEIHAFKESEGYPDTFFSFFINGNQKAWKVVDVYADRITYLKLQLGPKYATLKLFVTDENGKPSGGSMTFVRLDDPTRPYRRGGDLSGTVTMLVPSVPFRFDIQKDGYRVWRSKVIRLKSDEVFSMQVHLERSR